MKAIILAAGFGTRLYPITRDVPKALLDIGDRTILDHLMGKLEKVKAIDEVILVTNEKFHLKFLRWHGLSYYKKPIRILSNSASHPGEALGAVRDLNFALRSGFCGSDDFLVFCADNYFNFPISYFLLPVLGHPRSVFVGIHDVEDKEIASNYGVVLIDEHNRIEGFEEKPAAPKSTKVSVGVYYLPGAYRLRVHEYLEIDKENPDKIGSFFEWLSKKDSDEPLYAIDFYGKWFDIGTPQSYDEVRGYVRDFKAA